MVSNQKPRVIIYGTGGTVAGSAPSPTDTTVYASGALSIQNLISAVPEIQDYAHITGRQLFSKGSPDITNELLIRLSHQIQSDLDKDEVAGVVITHGTDTMEETAFFLELTINSPKPVVLVGAMRPSTAHSADGPMNLLQAVAVAAHRASRDRGVMIVMNDRILPARFATKTSANPPDAFHAGDPGTLGTAQDVTPRFFYPPRRPLGHRHLDIRALDPDAGLPRVDILYGHPGLGEDLVRRCHEGGAWGVVLAGMGAGCWTTDGGESIDAVLGGGAGRGAGQHVLRVVVSFRTTWGYVGGHGRIYGLDRGRVAEQAIGSGHLNPPKSRIQLQLCLALRMKLRETLEVFAGEP